MGKLWTEKIVVILAAAWLMQGCGIKGGLYIPDENRAQSPGSTTSTVVSIYDSRTSSGEAAAAEPATDTTSGASTGSAP